jgi:hypothetical protein
VTNSLKYFTSCFGYWWRFPARAQTHRAVQHIPRWMIGRALSMVCFQVIIWKAWPWTIECNMFGECHTPCRPKTSFVDFGKKSMRIVAATKDYIFRPYPSLLIFSVTVKSGWPYEPIFPSFLYNFHILFLVLNIAEILLARRLAIINRTM